MHKDEAYWNSPEGLREQAAYYVNDNYSPGDLGYCKPERADWTREWLSPEQLTASFATADRAREWLQGEIDGAEADGLNRDWRALLTEEIREEVIVLIRDGLTYIWDGWHRVGASVATARPVLAIVGRPHKAT